MTAIPPNSPSPINGSLPGAPPTAPSDSGKRSRSEPSEGEPALKRQKIEACDAAVALCENSGAFCPVPSDLVHRILSYCKASALVRMGTTCQRLFYLADRAPMWQGLCLRAKLSVKEHASHRLEFLAAIGRGDFEACIAKGLFFNNGKYTRIDKKRSFSCFDHAIQMEPLLQNTAFSERQIDAILFKASEFFGVRDLQRSEFAPGQIDLLYSQLTHLIATCPARDKVAKAHLYQTCMQLNDAALGVIPYSFIWNAFNQIRHDKGAKEVDRNRAEYMLCFLPRCKQDVGWNLIDLAQFRHNQGDLPDAERARILKKGLNDKIAPEWLHRLVKHYLAEMRLNRQTEEITDKEAYEMLESLKNSPLTPEIGKTQIKDFMQQFKDQKRV